MARTHIVGRRTNRVLDRLLTLERLRNLEKTAVFLVLYRVLVIVDSVVPRQAASWRKTYCKMPPFR